MAGVPVAGNSYIEISDADGVLRNLSPFLEEVDPLGRLVSYVDVTGLNDEASRVAEGNAASQEFTLRGLFDDTPDTGSDAVLGGIVGREVTVSYGPAGKATGERKITGRFLCTGYQVGGRLEKGKAVGLVRFVARFRQSGPVTLTRWE